MLIHSTCNNYHSCFFYDVPAGSSHGILQGRPAHVSEPDHKSQHKTEIKGQWNKLFLAASDVAMDDGRINS